jgi:hypothetical protein
MHHNSLKYILINETLEFVLFKHYVEPHLLVINVYNEDIDYKDRQ